MDATAHITDTATGETRKMADRFAWSGPFIWADGNFRCDCNRGAFFAEAGGEDTDAIDEDEAEDRWPCGHDRYRVRLTADDGAVLYEDA